MKFEEAMMLIKQKSEIKRSMSGYRVRFEYLDNHNTVHDMFPETTEMAIKSLKRATKIANKFKAKTSYKNIYVVDKTYKPIS